MYKLKAKVLISKNPCNCKGFYHPGEIFTESNVQKVKRYIKKNWVEVLEEPVKEVTPVAEKEEKKAVRKTKEKKV